MARIGPLLENALARIEASADTEAGLLAAAAHIGLDEEGAGIPVVMKSNGLDPIEGESWDEFRARSEADLAPIRDTVNGEAQFLYAANSVAVSLPLDQVRAQAENPLISAVELDPIVVPTLMDDAIIDIGVAPFREKYGPLTGEGVRVAVLDSGIDLRHPFLRVPESTSTCGESDDLPGSHGTHCAGSIASQDLAFPGVAPSVTLLNVKVLRADGSGRHTDIAKGVDAALDRNADILSLSLGFNHLPAWSDRGHGWGCSDGLCPLCTAIDNAVRFGRTAIVAAGNEHERAERLRNAGHGGTFDTELGCPGQARGAITVGAVTKRTFLPAGFSSHGPAAYGDAKPQLCAPGVNIMSTIPVPRDAGGQPVATPLRAHLFGRKSGTSMATPIVAGIAALIMQHLRAQGLGTGPADMRAALVRATRPLADAAAVVGAGLSDLDRY